MKARVRRNRPAGLWIESYIARSGVEPSLYMDLVTVRVANTNWQTINTIAQTILSPKTKEGPEVVLNPQEPLSLQAA